jgi:Subtilisin inhibitor-like
VRFAVLGIAVLLATGCMSRSSSEDQGAMSGETSLEISVTPGSEAPTKIWTLRCPDGGTLPDAAEACSKLEDLDDPFAPVPEGVACTQIYGGPQEADVRGVFRGRRVEAHFDRGNGCEIERWDKVEFLFPGT